MANGMMKISKAPSYEDYTSLKKYLRKNSGTTWKDINLSRFMFNQAGTGGAVEVEDKGTETIVDIGKTELTLLLAGDADNASTNTNTYNLTYLDSDGISHDTVGTGTATLNGTPVAFVPAVADFYSVVSFSGPADANVVVYAATAAIAAIYATISKGGATAATEAQLVGVGKVMAQTMVADATQQGKEVYLEYVTPWGAIKYGIATLDGADTSTEVVWYESSSAYVATTVLVKDFYRRRCLEAELASVATKEIGVVAVGGAAIYAIIGALQHASMHSRFHTITGRDTWLARIVMTVSVATKVVTQLTITFTPYGDTDEHNIVISVGEYILVDPCIRLAPNTDLKFEILGNLTDNTFNIHVLEAVQV